MTREWLQELDYFRGFAILGVIAIHSFVLPPPSLLKYYIGYQASPMSELINNNVWRFMVFSVPFFILISGTVLAYNYFDKIDLIYFYKKRLLRIIPPYIFISLISIFSLGLLSQMPSLGTIIFKLLTGTANDTLWFVAVIIQLYILFPFIFILIMKWQRESSIFFIIFPAIALLIQLIWVLSWSARSIYFPDGGTGSFFNTIFLVQFFYFVIGIYFGLYYKETIAFIKSSNILGPLAFSLASFLCYLQFDSPGLSDILKLIFIISAFVLIIRVTSVIIEWKSPLASFIRYIGVISFGVYLIHPFFAYFFWILLSRSGIDPSNLLYFPLFFLLLVISSVLAIRLLLRVPYHKWLIGV
jgi:peptidoglycan/LPS O-acetylase OafA/YrhL